MGTNFYARLSIKSRDLKKAIEYNQQLRYYREDHRLDKKYVVIHLGKRSAGWKFLFNANQTRFYELSIEGISKFIKENKARIFDEYRREFGLNEFWNEEVAKFLYTGYDLSSYYKEANRNNYGDPRYTYTYIETNHPSWSIPYNPNKHGEFYSDGLRFTTTSEFS